MNRLILQGLKEPAVRGTWWVRSGRIKCFLETVQATGKRGQCRKDTTGARDAQTCTKITTRRDTHSHHHHHTHTTHTRTQGETDRESSQKCSSSASAPTFTHTSQADKHTWMCTWMRKQKCVRCFRPSHCVVNHKNIMSVTELPHLNLLLRLKSLADKPQEWWTKTTAFMSHLEVASGENLLLFTFMFSHGPTWL